MTYELTNMHFSYLRRLDKVLVPITFRLFPVEVFMQGIRRAFNIIHNKYLNYYNGWFPPDVLYLSDNYLVINKPFDVKVNSDKPTEYTVATQLKQHFPDLVDETCSHHFRFTHRLDYPTSGILCLALNNRAARKVHKQFLKRTITKHYLALVGGFLSEPYILVDVPIGKDSLIDYKHKMCPSTSKGCIKSRSAVTLIILLEHGMYGGSPSSKVLLIPFTGRTHQLRVHCNLIGHTIIGDYTYSNEKDTEPYRMMLHAYRLTAPINTEPMDILSPDPFISDIDSKWKPHKVFKTYEGVIEEKLTVTKIQAMDILRYCVMSVKTKENG